MFGLGFTEIVVILAVALIVLGPKKLPEAARSMGRMVAQLRHAADDFRREMDDADNKFRTLDAPADKETKEKSREKHGS